LVGEFPTVLEDGGVTSEWRDATHVGFAVEEELEDCLGVVGTRFGDDIVEIGSMRDGERPKALRYVGAQQHCFGAGAKDVDSVFGCADRVMFVSGANNVISAVGFEKGGEFFGEKLTAHVSTDLFWGEYQGTSPGAYRQR
jgi:hypothetical protein